MLPLVHCKLQLNSKLSTLEWLLLPANTHTPSSPDLDSLTKVAFLSRINRDEIMRLCNILAHGEESWSGI